MTATPPSLGLPGSAAVPGSLASRFRALVAPGTRTFAAGDLPAVIRRSLGDAEIAVEPTADFDRLTAAEKSASLLLAMAGDLSTRVDFIVRATESGAVLVLVSLESASSTSAHEIGRDLWEIGRFACFVADAPKVSASLRICAHRAAASPASAIRMFLLAQQAQEREREAHFAAMSSTLAGLEARLAALERREASPGTSRGDEPGGREPALEAMRETVLGLFSSLARASEERQAEMRRVANELAALRKNLEPALSMASAIRRLFSKKEEALSASRTSIRIEQ